LLFVYHCFFVTAEERLKLEKEDAQRKLKEKLEVDRKQLLEEQERRQKEAELKAEDDRLRQQQVSSSVHPMELSSLYNSRVRVTSITSSSH